MRNGRKPASQETCLSQSSFVRPGCGARTGFSRETAVALTALARAAVAWGTLIGSVSRWRFRQKESPDEALTDLHHQPVRNSMFA